MLKGAWKDISSFKGEKLDSHLNSYPCNSGLVMDLAKTDLTFGIAISHAVMC
jgi:hypothetical protein